MDSWLLPERQSWMSAYNIICKIRLLYQNKTEILSVGRPTFPWNNAREVFSETAELQLPWSSHTYKTRPIKPLLFLTMTQSSIIAFKWAHNWKKSLKIMSDRQSSVTGADIKAQPHSTMMPLWCTRFWNSIRMSVIFLLKHILAHL